MILMDEDDDQRADQDYEEEEESVGGGYTVSMKGAPNMATVQWVATERQAIEKTAREWGCSPDVLYIYRGESL